MSTDAGNHEVKTGNEALTRHDKKIENGSPATQLNEMSNQAGRRADTIVTALGGLQHDNPKIPLGADIDQARALEHQLRRARVDAADDLSILSAQGVKNSAQDQQAIEPLQEQEKTRIQKDHTVSTSTEVFPPLWPDKPGAKSLEAAVIPRLSSQDPESYTKLVVGDKEIAVPSEVLRRIVETTQEAYNLADAGYDLYCEDFGAILGGGSYIPRNNSVFWGIPAPTLEFEDDGMIDITDESAIDALPSMQPLEMGTMQEDGTFDPAHTVVKIPETNLCISKLGSRATIVITDFPSLAEHYESTHCVPITSMGTQSPKTGEMLLEYYVNEDVRRAVAEKNEKTDKEVGISSSEEPEQVSIDKKVDIDKWL